MLGSPNWYTSFCRFNVTKATFETSTRQLHMDPKHVQENCKT